jgi:arginine/lysine/ornithine decarboxylase
MEMSAPSYVIALSSVGDTEEGSERLAQALFNLESEMEEEKHLPERTDDPEVQNSSPAEEAVSVYPEQVVPIAEAMEGKTKTISLMESEGCISAEFLLLYPPGIPLITPGERITGQLLQNVRRYLEQGLTVTGLKDRTNRQIEVIS